MKPANTTPPPQHEGIPALKVLLIGLSALALFTGAVWLTWRLMLIWRQEVPPAPLPASMGRVEVARVNQEPFTLDDRTRQRLRQQRERLRSYGWVDRSAGLIHIPIERAMEQRLVAPREGTP